MRLETLQLRQWRVFDELDLEFSDGLIGVRGQNGAGKTTLAEAIGWALFGKLRGRAKVSDLRRQGAPDGARSSVTLSFRLGDVRYRVERVVHGSAKLWIGDGDEPETAQTRATNVRIAQELNMTWDLFCRTVYARQKDVAALDPEATGDARRLHVERLLGLGRVRDAAARARDEHRRIKAELDGMRLSAPDPAELRERVADAERRAADTPAVSAASDAATEARTAYDAARQATSAEAVRAARYEAIAPRAEQLNHELTESEARLAAAERRCEERDAAAERVDQIGGDAAGADEADALLARWVALQHAISERETAKARLAEIGFDAGTDAERRVELQRLERELGELVIPGGVPALTARVAALSAVEQTGALEPAEHSEHAANTTHGVSARTAAGLAARLEQEREHLTVLTGDDGAACPVCLRPYEGPRDALVSEHQARIDALAAGLETAEAERAAAALALDAARVTREAAARAADALATTQGAATLAAARTALEAVTEQRTTALQLQGELRKFVSELKAAQEAQDEPRRLHGQRFAAVSAREDDVAQRAAALAVNDYDATAHSSAAAESVRLRALGEQLLRSRAIVEAAAECDAARDTSAAELVRRRDELAATRDELKKLAFDAAAHERLEQAEREAEERWDELRDIADRLRIAAAEASTEVAGLRERLQGAEQRRRDIAAHETEARAHGVAFDVLSAYRDAQTQRAWPALETTAGALLAQATDGRYADVRFSGDDFRLVIVDRGEEHAFDRFSGGEQDLANLCVRLAIADWIARERDVELGFVVLDEVFGSQDEDRRRGLMDQLRRLSERFHQMIVITHVAEIADQCDTVIALEQVEQGRSRIAA